MVLPDINNRMLKPTLILTIILTSSPVSTQVQCRANMKIIHPIMFIRWDYLSWGQSNIRGKVNLIQLSKSLKYQGIYRNVYTSNNQLYLYVNGLYWKYLVVFIHKLFIPEITDSIYIQNNLY